MVWRLRHWQTTTTQSPLLLHLIQTHPDNEDDKWRYFPDLRDTIKETTPMNPYDWSNFDL